MSNKKKILFICQHNSGRSQIAEAYLRKIYGEYFEIESAGLEPARAINPLVIQVMAEEGIDLSNKKPQSVFELYKGGNLYEHVITVCQNSESKCPVFPGITKRWHIPFPDPDSVKGNQSDKLEKVRNIRDMIKNWLINPPQNSLDFKKLSDS